MDDFAPTSTPGAGPSKPPTTPKGRRRSWFPFGSSSSASTSAEGMPPPPLPSSRRSSKTGRHALDVEEEVELAPMRTPRQSVDMARIPSASGQEELLTIDGQVEDSSAVDKQASIKRKKKKRRSKEEEQEGEAMRMTDFGPPRRTSTASDTTELPEGQQRAFSTRTFSRTASDRADNLAPQFVKPPPRVSSIPFHSRPPAQIARIPSDASNKEQPAVLIDRPLPPLPPGPAASPPPGLVVTPSSPRKDRHDTNHTTSLGSASDDMRLPRRSRSRESDQQTFRTSPIGLGLPRRLVPPDDHPLPPLPGKKQSVSTPVGTRTPSPVPKIAFAEPEDMPQDRGRSRTTSTEAGKEKKVKRARSLSGIFKSSPVVTTITPTQSRPTTPDPGPTQDEEHEGTKSGGGMLEWLGMRKAVKRRQSETHLRRKPENIAQPADIPRIPSPAPRTSHDARSSAHSSFVDLVNRASQDAGSRPSSRNGTLAASPSKLGSLFARRQSSKQSSTSNGASPPASLPPTKPSTSGAASTRSSFSLPPFEPAVSPIYPNSGPWMSSPSTDTEEMLFSPEGDANWRSSMRPWMDNVEHQQRTQPPHSARSSISSPPLGSLPEQGVLASSMPMNQPNETGNGGRGRSHSDAPQPSASVRIHDPRTDGHESPASSTSRLAASLQSSPVAQSRPKLGNRSHSGNAAIIDRMKTVFARSSSRQRASTLLPEHHQHLHAGDIDEFGALRNSGDWPSNASSVSFSSPPAPASRVSIDDSPATGSLLGIQDAERRRVYQQDSQSNRSSIISQATTASARAPEMRKEGSFISRARPRASTLSSGPTTQPLLPPSPQVYPAAATPPRRRPSAIRKLSNTLLGASARPSSQKANGLFPLPPRSSGSMSSGFAGAADDGGSGLSPAMSPRPSMGSITPASANNYKQVAKRVEDETAEAYAERLSASIPRNEIAGYLATSSDPFHLDALRYYMGRFDFAHQPLDVALRQLLMQMSLPKETQQIDRVMEAFAARYEDCEPGLFRQKDNTYVLAFSMMMLHTDAFNKHNKNKMTKPDYVRNTRLDGVSPLVLEAFFDNITFTPFVFIEDDADLLPSDLTEQGTPSTGVSTPGSMPPPKSSKIDVYHMIVNRQLRALQVDVDRLIPPETPFAFYGPTGVPDVDSIHRCFADAHLLQVTIPGRRKTSTGILSSTPTRGAPPVDVTIKVVKVGLLSRCDEPGDSSSSKKTSRKWKTWSVILTASQLLFFKDSLWAVTLQELTRRAATGNDDTAQPLTLPPGATFKPDEVFSLKDCVAVHDKSLTRSPHTFRLVMPHYRQYLFSAPDEREMNRWIALVNHAASFKTAGLRMRGAVMNKDQAVLAGAAAAASHKRETQAVLATPGAETNATPRVAVTTPKKAVFGDSSFTNTAASHTTPETPKSDTLKVADTTDLMKASIDVDAAEDAVVDEGEQLEEVFDVIKAELAAGRGGATKKARPASAASNHSAHSVIAQNRRAAAFRTQLDRLSTKRQAHVSQLATHLLTARNLAILTPFQKATRERISAAIPPLAQQVREDRLHLVRYDCWISILQQELDKEQQEWARVRHVALQAAAKSLKDPKGVKAVVDDVNDDVPHELPRLSLPDSTESGSTTTSYSPVSPLEGFGSPAELPVVMRRSSDSQGPRNQRSNSSLLSSSPGKDDRDQRHRDRDRSPPTGRSTPLMFSLSESEDNGKDEHPPKSNGEEAEDWQKTRAAKRVSLASVDIPDTEIRRLSLKKKREREVTAIFVGKDDGK